MGIGIDAELTVAAMRSGPDTAAELMKFAEEELLAKREKCAVDLNPAEELVRLKFKAEFGDRNYYTLSASDWGLSKRFMAFVEVVCKDDQLLMQREVWAPDGEKILEESSNGIYDDSEPSGVRWTNPDFGKKTLEEIIAERGAEFEIKFTALGQG